MPDALDQQSKRRRLVLPTSLVQTFAALRYPNYRLWFSGQIISLIGTWMQTTAQGYLVFELTRSPAFLGYVGFVGGLPSWLFTLYAGVISDRLSRRTVLLITQIFMMVLAFILAGLVFAGLIQPWHILVLAFLLGSATAFDAPARQAFVVELVDRDDLTNAIALNSTMFNTGTVVGPAVAGLTYALFGPAWCFTINGLSFLAVIIALALIKIQIIPSTRPRTSTLHELKDGLVFAASHQTIRTLIIIIGLVSAFGLGVITLLPAWAVKVLEGDVTTNGALLSARGIGALAAALTIAALSRNGVKGRLWSYGSFILPLLIILFTQMRWLPLSMAAMAGVGMGFMLLVNSSNALVQTHIPDHLRGRVMSIYILVFFGGMPLGSLLAGTLAAYIGEPLTVMLSGLVLLALASFVWLRMPEIRKLP